MVELEFSVWQFVRLMVELEDGQTDGPSFRAWRGAWVELDSRLEKLRTSDATGFADLMMNQEVAVKADKAQLLESAAALNRVAKSLAKALKKAGDDTARETLLFEQGELIELAGRIRQIAASLEA